MTKTLYPAACYVGIADGGADHWPWLEAHTDRQGLDFWHPTEYLAEASAA